LGLRAADVNVALEQLVALGLAQGVAWAGGSLERTARTV
jgi:hypothetical protein